MGFENSETLAKKEDNKLFTRREGKIA